jgi:cytoskeletal protein RodZ
MNGDTAKLESLLRVSERALTLYESLINFIWFLGIPLCLLTLITAHHCLSHCNRDDKTPYLLAIIFLPFFGAIFYWWKQPYQLSEQAATAQAAHQREEAYRASLAKQEEAKRQTQTPPSTSTPAASNPATPIHLIHTQRTQPPFPQQPKPVNAPQYSSPPMSPDQIAANVAAEVSKSLSVRHADQHKAQIRVSTLFEKLKKQGDKEGGKGFTQRKNES